MLANMSCRINVIVFIYAFFKNWKTEKKEAEWAQCVRSTWVGFAYRTASLRSYIAAFCGHPLRVRCGVAFVSLAFWPPAATVHDRFQRWPCMICPLPSFFFFPLLLLLPRLLPLHEPRVQHRGQLPASGRKPPPAAGRSDAGRTARSSTALWTHERQQFGISCFFVLSPTDVTPLKTVAEVRGCNNDLTIQTGKCWYHLGTHQRNTSFV